MPIFAGVGISSNQDYKMAVAEAISQARARLKQREISLAIVFSTPEFAFPYLLRAIANFIGSDIPLVGATSNAIFNQERICSHGLTIALLSAKEVYFNTAVAKNATANLEASGNSLGRQLIFGLRNARRCFCLFFSDGMITDNLPLLRGLQQRLGLSFPIIGANTASDNIDLNKTYQYFNQQVLSDSVVGLLWAGRVAFGLGIKHGWKPIGKPHRIDTSDASAIRVIENKPAVSLYQSYFAKDIPELKKELRRISCLYPMGINISGQEEYLLRNVLSIREDGSLLCRDGVPEKSQVRLMIGNKESWMAAADEAARETKQALAAQMLPAQGKASIIFVFNSVSRLQLLGRHISKELKIIQSHFPDTPVVGLCTYGEQAPLKATDFAGQTYCHNQTIALLAIS